MVPATQFTVQDASLRAGQEWLFEGRPGDPQPILVIVRIDWQPKVGKVVPVSIRGVPIRNRRAPGGFSASVSHMPFSSSALERSTVKLLHHSVILPSYEEGYQQWKDSHRGVFAITAREALDFVERALQAASLLLFSRGLQAG